MPASTVRGVKSRRRATERASMRLLAAVLSSAVFALAAAGADAPNPLVGTWKSNRAATLDEMAKATLTPQQRALLSAPDFFGQLVLAIDETSLVASLPDGWRSSSTYRVVARDGVAFEIDTWGAGEPRVRKRVRVTGGRLYVPISELGFDEVFDRVIGAASSD